MAPERDPDHIEASDHVEDPGAAEAVRCADCAASDSACFGFWLTAAAR